MDDIFPVTYPHPQYVRRRAALNFEEATDVRVLAVPHQHRNRCRCDCRGAAHVEDREVRPANFKGKR
jgi:hypothetical protein